MDIQNLVLIIDVLREIYTRSVICGYTRDSSLTLHDRWSLGSNSKQLDRIDCCCCIKNTRYKNLPGTSSVYINSAVVKQHSWGFSLKQVKWSKPWNVNVSTIKQVYRLSSTRAAPQTKLLLRQLEKYSKEHLLLVVGRGCCFRHQYE